MRCDAIDIDSQMKVEESSGKGVCHVLITELPELSGGQWRGNRARQQVDQGGMHKVTP
jgi:hypothetical protein